MSGGERKGAGRKPCPDTKKRCFACKLPPYLLAWMRAQDTSQAMLIENALVEKHQIPKPEKK